MTTRTALSKGLIGGLAAATMLAGASAAQAESVTLRTASLRRPDGGYLYCVVRADSAAPIDLVTSVLTRGGANVTDFGSAFVAAPVVTGDDRYHAENTAGSMDKRAASCETTAVSDGPSGDLAVSVTLEARDADGNVVKTVSVP